MNIDNFIETFVNGDFFIVFLAIMFVILIVLVLALIKLREENKQLLGVSEPEESVFDSDNPLDELLATNGEDVIDEDKPLIKQIDISNIKTYHDIIDDYQYNEEESAVISADELEKKAQERFESLGVNSNQEAIAKYEEDQENKAIISYEQLLKNASNINISYKEEKKEEGAPKINKIELEPREIVPSDYIAEEEFLKILKEFRINLE